MLISEYNIAYEAKICERYTPGEGFEPVELTLNEVSGAGKTHGTIYCWVTDVVRGWVCVDPPYTGDDPGDGEAECTLASEDIYITCVEFDDPGGGGGGDGGGSGGGGGDDGDGEEEEEEDESTSRHFSLTCDSVPRGGYVMCTVTTDSIDLDLSQLTFEWSAETGAEYTDTGASSWSGTATNSTTVQVRVNNEDVLSHTVDVKPRYWSFGQLGVPVQYTNQPRESSVTKVGFYRLNDNVTIWYVEGTGPWEGRWMTALPPVTGQEWSGELHIAEDYDPAGGGPGYSGANSTCTAASDLPPDSDYTTVNTTCGTLPAMDGFRGQIIAHERRHEAGYNACLSSHRARQLLKGFEELVFPDLAEWTSTAWDLMAEFWNQLRVSGSGIQGDKASNSFWLNDGSWRHVRPAIAAHSGPYGC